MASQGRKSRVFKSAWFAKAARKARIGDAELCEAIRQVMLGQADDLGGGVFKKRLNKNMYRGIILAKAGRHWVYEYLYAKQDRDNIDDEELSILRRIAKGYADLTDREFDRLVQEGKLMEICRDSEAQI